MNRIARLLLIVLVVVGALDALLAVRIAGRDRDARVELGRHKLSELSEATLARLRSLQDSVLLTLYVSPSDQMPSEMRRLERDARDVFEALKAAGGGRVEYQIVDPSADEALEKFAGRRKVAPVRVRSVDRDGWSEKTVWSSLGVTYGARPPVVYNGLRPEQLPLLQDLLVAQLDQLERPRRAKVALATPGSGIERFTELAEDIATRAEVVKVDLDGGAPFPREADILVWLQPGPADASRVRELELFLESGHSVLLAGAPRLGPFAGGLANVAEQPVPRPVPSGLSTLLGGFGLAQREGLLGDTMAAALKAEDGTELPAPWLLRCIAPQQDFHTFKGQPNGHLYFETPAPFLLDGERLRDRGLIADILGTSSDKAWIQPEVGTMDLQALAPDKGEPAPRVPLMVALRPSDPWQGVLVAVASTTPFQDGWYRAEGNAHPRLTKTLLDNLTTDERLLAGGLLNARAAPLPELPAADRALWRALCVGLLPLLLLVVGLLRGAFGWGARSAAQRMTAAQPVRAAATLRLVGGLALILIVVTVLRGGARADMTADRIHALAPRTAELAAAATGPRALKAEIFFSAAERLPPSLRTVPQRLADQLAEIGRAGAELDVVVRHPEDLPPAEQQALAAQGIAPVEVSTHDEEVTAVRRVWASLRLSSGERSTLLSFGGGEDPEALPFRLAFALWRLQEGRPVRVGFASDAPRLTAAEAYEMYQQQGLFAPAGTDVYAVAARSLAAADFEVERINPRDPVLPPGLDAIVWLQPRRSIDKMLEATVLYLHGGGKLLLGAQQFVMQPRQYPGRDYMTVWWPAPQTPDVDAKYFPTLGLKLAREVLFDELKTNAPLETLVYAGTRRDARRQDTALPFVLRVSAANFADSPITRGLSDLAFVCPAFFRTDEALLAQHGLVARPLFTCSEKSWAWEWKHGFLEPGLLEKPIPIAGDEPQPYFLGRVPLGLDVTGTFPLPPEPIVVPPPITDAEGNQTPAPPREWPPPGAPQARPGRLVYLADTECFKNYRLLDPEFRSDTLLLNAVASLTLDEGLAAVASQRPAPRGLPIVAQDSRLHWRAAVLGAFPAAMLLFGLIWALLRRGGR